MAESQKSWVLYTKLLHHFPALSVSCTFAVSWWLWAGLQRGGTPHNLWRCNWSITQILPVPTKKEPKGVSPHVSMPYSPPTSPLVTPVVKIDAKNVSHELQFRFMLPYHGIIFFGEVMNSAFPWMDAPVGKKGSSGHYRLVGDIERNCSSVPGGDRDMPHLHQIATADLQEMCLWADKSSAMGALNQ